MEQLGRNACFNSIKASDTRILKSINLVAVLSALRQIGPASRADISRITKLTPATVSSIISLLISQGIAKEVGYGESSGGRPPVMIEFNPKAFYLAGVDLGATKAIAVVTDLEGNIITRTRMELDVNEGCESVMSNLFRVTESTLEQAADAHGKIAGLGLSVPGLIDAELGISVFAPNIPGWRNIPLVKVFQDKFHVPCKVENDARAMAIGEAMFGAGQGYANILCVNVGRGIGAGIIINGEIYRGKQGGAGELGHITIDPEGPVCPCGNHGCLEVMAAGPAIASSAVKAVRAGESTLIRDLVDGNTEDITAEIVSLAAKKGDVLAEGLIRQAGRRLGIGIANAVNMLSPEIVIIGGGVSRAGDVFFEEIRDTVKKRAFTTMVNLPPIVASTQGEEASSVGAAALVLEEMLAVGNMPHLMPFHLNYPFNAPASKPRTK
jgi:N-acetylglucosamine repressor